MNKSAQFTPGPWEVKPIGKQLYVEAKDGQGFVCDMQINDALGETDGPRIRADAHLIAAAPAMYEALSELVKYLREQVADEALDTWAPVFKAAMALTQAEGKAL